MVNHFAIRNASGEERRKHFSPNHAVLQTQAYQKHDVVSVKFTFALVFLNVPAVSGSRLMLARHAKEHI